MNTWPIPRPPFDPASADSWPDDTRGLSLVDFSVPPNQQINMQSVEVKLTITGDPANLNFLRIDAHIAGRNAE